MRVRFREKRKEGRETEVKKKVEGKCVERGKGEGEVIVIHLCP